MIKLPDAYTIFEGLLYKLECNGINGNPFTLIESYLANRTQMVVLNGKCSKWVPLCVGVLQGSVLGPLIFLVYIDDLINNLKCDVNMLRMTHLSSRLLMM